MAAVKEHLASVGLPRNETEKTAPPRFNVLSHLTAAHKALVGTAVESKGVVRELTGNDHGMALSIGGHRGMGENLLNDHEPLSMLNLWRENSVKSFLKAHEHGARFVEMDVQVTADGVPVIWHDDDILFGLQSKPISCRVADMYYNEFKSLGPQRLDQNGQMGELVSIHRNFRSRRNVHPDVMPHQHMAWRCFDEDALPSLEDVLRTLPLDLGLNLEIKMATPATLARTPMAELERMTEPIIRQLQSLSKIDEGRQIVISSFDPDICTEVRRKLAEMSLASIPVMLLTTGGASFHADPRRMSIASAIDYCIQHQFKGIVVDTSRLRQEKHFVETANRHQLQVMTYGLENDDMEWLTEQWKLGVHGAIVDDVQTVVPGFIRHVKQLCTM